MFVFFDSQFSTLIDVGLIFFDILNTASIAAYFFFNVQISTSIDVHRKQGNRAQHKRKSLLAIRALGKR